jgi:hypothetical protein
MGIMSDGDIPKEEKKFPNAIIAISNHLDIQKWDSLQRRRWGFGISIYARMGYVTS